MNPPPKPKGEARLKIEAYLSRHKSPVSAHKIAHVTGLEREQVNNTLGSMRKAGHLVVSGCRPDTLYRLVEQAPPEPKPTPRRAAWKPPAARPEPEIIYPAGYRHSTGVAAAKGGTYQGPDWSRSTQRPGCLDHEQIASRRGNERVAHRPPFGARTPSPRPSGGPALPA